MAIIFTILALLMILLMTYNRKSKSFNSERFFADAGRTSSVAASAAANPDAAAGAGGPVAPSDTTNEVYNPVGFGAVGKPEAGQSPTPSCYPRDRLTTDDLLPKDSANSRWAQMNPAGQGDIGNQNYLTAGYHMGINTQGQTLKNANLQLRSEPPNPQLPVSPWNMSTIEYDARGGRSFEIGTSAM